MCTIEGEPIESLTHALIVDGDHELGVVGHRGHFYTNSYFALKIGILIERDFDQVILYVHDSVYKNYLYSLYPMEIVDLMGAEILANFIKLILNCS